MSDGEAWVPEAWREASEENARRVAEYAMVRRVLFDMFGEF